MSSNINTIVTVIGYTFFAISEIVAVLPIPANGVLHSLIIGLKNSVQKPNTTDIEMAQTLIANKPDMASIITTLEGNPRLIETVKIVINNPEIIRNVEKIAKDKNLQFLNTLLINNKEIINDIKIIVIQKISEFQNPQQVQNPDESQINATLV